MAQFRTDQLRYLNNGNTVFEVSMKADQYGAIERNAEFTSKNRIKVSTYETVFFNTFQYGKETDVWDELTANGGSAVHNANTNMVDMSVSSTLGSKITRQSKNVQRYVPGRNSTATFAVRLQTPVTGIRRRFGLFEEENGFFFEDAGVIGADGLPEYNVVVRSKVTGVVLENRIPRSQWNGDKLDGAGPSKIVADATKQQIINFEYEWYGAGQIAIGFVINGFNHVVHTFNHANLNDLPWASTPFLPIRMEIENLTGVAGTHYIYQGSNSIISEGVPDILGIAESILSPITGTVMTAANLWYPILSLRLKATALKGIVLPTSFQVVTEDNTTIYYKVCRNTVIGTGGSAWTNHPSVDAFTQYQTYTSPSAISEVNNGIAIISGFVSAGSAAVIDLNADAANQIGRSSLGTVSDTITILCASSGTNKEVIAALTWIEQR